LVNFYQTTRRSNTGQPSFYLDWKCGCCQINKKLGCCLENFKSLEFCFECSKQFVWCWLICKVWLIMRMLHAVFSMYCFKLKSCFQHLRSMLIRHLVMPAAVSPSVSWLNEQQFDQWEFCCFRIPSSQLHHPEDAGSHKWGIPVFTLHTLGRHCA
jgi:hypothetical protein